MITKSELKNYMKENHLEYLSVLINENDELAIMVHLTPAGKLVDYHNKTFKPDTVWGRISYNGALKWNRIPFSAANN